LDLLIVTTSNNISHPIKTNSQIESSLSTQNGAKHETIQSFFLIFFLPIITSTYSILL
jgi:hypothetical protein